MAKLHELLAVQNTLKKQADTRLAELSATFDKKEHLFQQKRVIYQPKAEGAERKVEEQLDLTTTVIKELKWIKGILVPAIDVGYQIDVANTIARADIELDGKIIAQNVPTTALMSLEHTFDKIFEFVSRIKTLDSASGFRPDPDTGEGVYVSRDIVRPRTAKKKDVITLAPATPEHPAQAQLIDVEVLVGETTTTHWSGLLTVAQKGDMLERVEKLRNAIKAAKARANSADVPKDVKIANDLLSYVFAN